MSSEKPASPGPNGSDFIILYEGKSEHKLEKTVIEQLGALDYPAEKIAMYFDIPKPYIENELAREESELVYYLRRGRLMYEAQEQMSLLMSAGGGNVTAGERLEERLEKIRREKNFEFSKLDIFGSIKNEVKFSKLKDFFESGGEVNLSNNEALYLEALRLIESFCYHYGDRKTLSLLQKHPFNLSYGKAKEIICESENLFYTNKNRNKQALRNKRAEMLMDMAIVLKETGKAVDFKIAGELIKEASRLQELDKADAQVLPPEVYRKEARILELEPARVNMQNIDRNEVAAQIDMLKIPETSKMRLRYDAMIEDIVPLKEYLNEQPAKD